MAGKDPNLTEVFIDDDNEGVSKEVYRWYRDSASCCPLLRQVQPNILGPVCENQLHLQSRLSTSVVKPM